MNKKMHPKTQIVLNNVVSIRSSIYNPSEIKSQYGSAEFRGLFLELTEDQVKALKDAMAPLEKAGYKPLNIKPSKFDSTKSNLSIKVKDFQLGNTLIVDRKLQPTQEEPSKFELVNLSLALLGYETPILGKGITARLNKMQKTGDIREMKPKTSSDFQELGTEREELQERFDV